MLRDITLGQYYPVDSLIHRLDPRTKLFGTMVFILSLFVANNIWGYLLGTIALAAVIVLTLISNKITMAFNPFKIKRTGTRTGTFLDL